jgi:hypothetical protein
MAKRRHEQERVDEQPEDEARHNQREIDDGRDRLAVEQQAERRQQDGEDVDHGLWLPAGVRGRSRFCTPLRNAAIPKLAATAPLEVSRVPEQPVKPA